MGRGERAKPITLESGPDGCPCVFGRVGCCVGGVAVEAEPSGIPMPRILPSLKLECEKLASEKTEMQRHYVMVRGSSLPVPGSGEEGSAVSKSVRGVNPHSPCHSGPHFPCL